MNRGITVVIMILALAIVPSRALAAGALEPLDQQLGAYSNEVVAKAISGGEPKVVAVLPFADDLRGVRRLGVVAAEKLQTKLVNLPNAKVAERQHLDDVMKEKKAWLADFMEDRDPAKRAEAAKVLKADYLVLGTLVPTKSEIRFTVRLVEAASGKAVSGAAREFTIPNTADLADLLWYVQRPEKMPERPAELPPIELAVSVLAQHRNADDTVREFAVKDGSVLHSGDQFQVQFTPVSDCWVYIFLFGSTGKCETLFPYKGVKLGNFVRGGVSYAVPDPDAQGGSRWFWLDEHPGTETLYIVASYGPMNDIAKVLAEMENSAAGQAALSDRVREQVDEVRKKSDESPGDGEGVTIRKAPASVEAPYGKAGEVLRGKFSCLKEIRLIHR